MTCLQTLSRHQGSVSCLATMHDRLYSGAVDHQVKVQFTGHFRAAYIAVTE